MCRFRGNGRSDLVSCSTEARPPPARRRGRHRSSALVESELLHHTDEVIEEVFLHDLAVDPVGHGAEIGLEGLARWGDVVAVGALYRAGHRAGELSDRTGPFALGEENLVRAVPDPVIGEGPEELDRLRPVVRTTTGRLRLTWPRHHGV